MVTVILLRKKCMIFKKKLKACAPSMRHFLN